MKTEAFVGTMESAYGTKLDTPIKFNGTFEAYESYDDLVTANDLPSNDDVLAFVNNRRKANERQKAMQSALDAAGIVKPTLESDEGLQIATLVKVYMARGKSREVAEQLAKAAISA